MKKVLAIGALLLGAVSISACSNNNQSLNASDLQHHRFVLTEVNGKTIAAKPQPFLEIGENLSVNGQMCNSFFGNAQLNNNIIKSSGLGMTRMMCADAQLNQLDGIINQLFTEGATISLDNNVLQLKNDKNTLIFTQKDLM